MFPTKAVRAGLLIFAAASLQSQTQPAKPAANGSPAAAARSLTAAEAREAQLTADTEKLYQLTRELKVELDKTTKDTLSLTVVRKATEIERLAHSIGERMKGR